jgi:hypothetical protein
VESGGASPSTARPALLAGQTDAEGKLTASVLGEDVLQLGGHYEVEVQGVVVGETSELTGVHREMLRQQAEQTRRAECERDVPRLRELVKERIASDRFAEARAVLNTLVACGGVTADAASGIEQIICEKLRALTRRKISRSSLGALADCGRSDKAIVDQMLELAEVMESEGDPARRKTLAAALGMSQECIGRPSEPKCEELSNRVRGMLGAIHPQRIKDVAVYREGNGYVAYFSLVTANNEYTRSSGKLSISMIVKSREGHGLYEPGDFFQFRAPTMFELPTSSRPHSASAVSHARS